MPTPFRLAANALGKARAGSAALLAKLGLRRSGHNRFRGLYATYAEAIAHVRSNALAGYDHPANVEINLTQMCELRPWDYPVLYWLARLSEEIDCIIDAGGHIGTKYRAFRRYLPTIDRLQWVVHDLPAMVSAGRQRAAAEGLRTLTFIDTLSAAPRADLLLASGLLQYLDRPFCELVGDLPVKPRHLLLNKVATSEGASFFSLENLGPAEAPYQVRNRAEFEASLHALGYDIEDQWLVAELAHAFSRGVGSSRVGVSTSRGYYAVLSR